MSSVIDLMDPLLYLVVEHIRNITDILCANQFTRCLLEVYPKRVRYRLIHERVNTI